jgi:basic membrane protein A
VWGIGVDADQSFLGRHILTIAVKRVDQAVFLTIRDVKEGKFRGGRNATFGLRDDGVGLGKISPKVPKADVAKVEKIRAQIASGKIAGIPTSVS